LSENVPVNLSFSGPVVLEKRFEKIFSCAGGL
jgi:hypothetical protein